jgi:dihydrofolate reductase
VSIHLIWAQAANGVVGSDNTLPWRIPEDLARFRALTTGRTVVMGRRTWESLPPRFRPLPDRRNVVVTRDASYDAPGAEVVTSVEAALSLSEEIWIGGGAQIYSATIPLADALHVTDVDLEVEGDTFAPALGPEWQTSDVGEWQTSSTGTRFRWRDLVRQSRQAGVPPGSR